MKIRLVHILNSLTGDREVKSINSLSRLSQYGVEYVQRLSPLYDGILPTPPINNPRNKAHYGLYLNYKGAILDSFTEDLDALIICECDSILNISYDNFVIELVNTLKFCDKHDIYQFSWGGIITHDTKQCNITLIDDNFPNYCVVDRSILAHFVILPKRSRDFYLYKVNNFGWDSADIWLNLMIRDEFKNENKQASVFNKLVYQCEGVSLLDNRIKGNTLNNCNFYEKSDGWNKFHTVVDNLFNDIHSISLYNTTYSKESIANYLLSNLYDCENKIRKL